MVNTDRKVFGYCSCYSFAINHRNFILVPKVLVKSNCFMTHIDLGLPSSREMEIPGILTGPHLTVWRKVVVLLTLQNVLHNCYRALLPSLHVSVCPSGL